MCSYVAGWWCPYATGKCDVGRFPCFSGLILPPPQLPTHPSSQAVRTRYTSFGLGILLRRGRQCPGLLYLTCFGKRSAEGEERSYSQHRRNKRAEAYVDVVGKGNIFDLFNCDFYSVNAAFVSSWF